MAHVAPQFLCTRFLAHLPFEDFFAHLRSAHLPGVSTQVGVANTTWGEVLSEQLTRSDGQVAEYRGRQVVWVAPLIYWLFAHMAELPFTAPSVKWVHEQRVGGAGGGGGDMAIMIWSITDGVTASTPIEKAVMAESALCTSAAVDRRSSTRAFIAWIEPPAGGMMKTFRYSDPHEWMTVISSVDMSSRAATPAFVVSMTYAVWLVSSGHAAS